jgi:hypothetical protein
MAMIDDDDDSIESQQADPAFATSIFSWSGSKYCVSREFANRDDRQWPRETLDGQHKNRMRQTRI